MSAFSQIAPYLTNPLVLTGFVLLLLFGIHRALLKSGVIPPLSPASASRTVQMLLRYGFIIGLAIIVAGFGTEVFRMYLHRDGNSGGKTEPVPKPTPNVSVRGHWKGQGHTKGWLFGYSDYEPNLLSFTLNGDGPDLFGSVGTPEWEYPIVDGKVLGDRIHFSVQFKTRRYVTTRYPQHGPPEDVWEPVVQMIQFHGQLSGHTITFTAQHEGHKPIAFTAVHGE